jgi:formate hydrogenlyase transcriptional activator
MAENSVDQSRYQTLIRLSGAIRSQSENLFDLVARELHQVISFQWVAFYDALADRIDWREEGDVPIDSPIDALRKEDTVAWWTYKRQELVVVPSIEQLIGLEPPLVGPLKAVHELGGRSLCALPVTTPSRELGSLVFVSTTENTFPPEEVGFLEHAANQMALAMDDALNVREAQRSKERLELLLDLTNKVVSTLDLVELLLHLGPNICRVMRCESSCVSLPDLETGLFRMHVFDFLSSTGDKREGIEVQPGSKIGEVFRTGRTALLTGEETAEKPYPEAEGAQTLCHIPIQGRDRILGVASVCSSSPNAFSNEDLVFMERVVAQIAIAIENAFAYGEIAALKDQLMREKVYLEDEIRSELHFEEIVGTSETLRHVLRQIEIVAPTESTVLIYGETGTGKELIARAVHNLSARKANAFVKLNCAAIPTGLLESELFGHERGAFTGAISQRIGRFELAHKGTIFLDEIGEIPLELQPKLLRVLQEREFERLGSSRTIRSDARLIAATNRDLEEMVEEGKFRADLYYRLNVFPVRTPPLRERPEDIPLLVRHFVQQFSSRNGKSIESIPSQTMETLVRYHWPGNVRELQNVIERAVILSTGSVLKVPIASLKALPSVKSIKKPEKNRDSLRDALSDQERTRIVEALEQSNWIVSGPAGAAARLGMKRSTLQFRMAKLGIHISRVGGVSSKGA